MMKSEYLRIGNIVRSKINGISQVEQVGSSINPEYVGGRSLEGKYWENSYLPVEIDIDWLLKCGFEKEDNYYVFHPILDEELSECNFFFSFESGNVCLREKYEEIFITECHFLHEFQNLYFALTCQELKIEL